MCPGSSSMKSARKRHAETITIAGPGSCVAGHPTQISRPLRGLRLILEKKAVARRSYRMTRNCSRRHFLGTMGMAAGAYMAGPSLLSAVQAPASRVAIGMCTEYDRQVRDVLNTMFDQLGGLPSL